MDSKNYKKLSKTISYALRHDPASFHLSLDSTGAVELELLLRSLEKSNPLFLGVTGEDIEAVIESSDKKRFVLEGTKIRASYGHSFRDELTLEAVRPPQFLYHGTSRNVLDKIMTEGIQPMNRQHVHLSTQIETAKMVASRKRGKTVILKIEALRLHETGKMDFYASNDDTWMYQSVPAGYFAVDE